MCWTINKWAYTQNTKKYRKVADEDIFVYKIGYKDGNGFSPYYRDEFIYNANMPNEEIKLYVNSSQVFDFRVDEGYHSYSEECYVRECITDNIDIYSPVSEKINNFDNYDEIYEQFAIGKFIIPKGSEYYENEYGEIVSSQIIWTGERYPINGYKNTTKVKFKDIDYVLDNR